MPPLKNLKHEKFARLYVKEPNATRAYSKVYPNNKNPDVSSSLLLGKDSARSRILELLDESGCTDDSLSKDLNSLRKAKKTVFIDGQEKKIPDNTTSLNAVRTCLELKGHLKNQSVQVLNLNLDQETTKQLLEVSARRKSLRESVQ